jgi:hypothetical protein
MYKKAVSLMKNENITHIIAVHKPLECLIAGALLKRKFSKCKLSYYFLDILSGGLPPSMFSKEWLEKRGRRWENYLFKYADNVFILRSHEKHYLNEDTRVGIEKIRIVDIPLLRDIKKETHTRFEYCKKNINLVYTGSFVKGLRNPNYFLRLLDTIKNDCDFVFHIYGSGDCDEIILKYKDLIKNKKIIQYGQVRTNEAYSAILSADFLVNIGSNNDFFIPSKIFEYISTGKPIISTYPIDTEPSIPYLQKYPNALLIKEDWNKIDENAERLKTFLLSSFKDVNFDDVERLYLENTPKHIVNYFLSE